LGFLLSIAAFKLAAPSKIHRFTQREDAPGVPFEARISGETVSPVQTLAQARKLNREHRFTERDL
jgi:hypothetical protein